MYAERAAYQTKQWFMNLIHDLMELLFHAAGLIIDTLRTFILIVLSIWSCGLRYRCVGWLVGLFDGVVLSLHLGVSLAARQFHPYGSAYEDPGLDDPEGHLRPERSQLPA